MSSKKPAGPVSLDDIIAASSPAERVVSMCVDASLFAEYQQLEQDLEAAQHEDISGGSRLGQVPAAPKIAKQIQAMQQAMEKHTYTFRFRALSAKAFSDLMLEHPDPAGKLRFNQETFEPALIAACCIEPAGMDDPEKLAKFMEHRNTAQMSVLFEGAWGANTGAPSVPFSYAASAVLRNSAASSTTASPSESPAASSSGE